MKGHIAEGTVHEVRCQFKEVRLTVGINISVGIGGLAGSVSP